MTDISDRKEMGVVLVAWSPETNEAEDLARTQPTRPGQAVQPAPTYPTTTSPPSPAGPIAGYDVRLPASQEERRGALRLHQGIDRLTHDILARGGYGAVEVGYYRNGRPSVEEAIERAIAHGVRRVVVVPLVFALGDSLPHPSAGGRFPDTLLNDLPQRISGVQARHSGIDIVYAGPPFDHERQVDLILSKIREYEPEALKVGLLHLNDLTAGETGVVRQLNGGPRFRSRMASLGFTLGVSVKMVQNYGHGAVIVRLRGTRVALGRGEAHKVGVARLVEKSADVEW
jgi:ferrous iron transport protein A